MTTATALTGPQLDHLRAAEAGALFVNDRGGLIRRAVRSDGRRVDQAVCERLRDAGLITKASLPGCAVQFRYDPTEAGRAVLGTDERRAP